MRKKILVVEDELEMRAGIVKLLELNDYETISASNGIVGLQMALQYIPDLIISDIMMPELDGYELLMELQKYSVTFSVPFLFLSARTDRSDIREGMKLGANDFLTKPFTFKELLEAINTQLDKKEKTHSQFHERFERLRFSIRRSLPHEIRTPMNSILGFTELLIKHFDSKKPEEVKECLQHILVSSHRLNDLLEKYLLYSNLELISSSPEEVKKLQSKITPFSKYLIADIVSYKAEKSNRKPDIQFNLEDATLSIGEEHLVTIIDEITDNCLKFSDTGTPIIVSSKLHPPFYHITFTDHGRGMTSEQINELGAFIQHDRKFYEQQGSGLGLAIVKRIAEIHKGDFSVESELSYFTTVTVVLPCLS